jgi:hypothetical protein
VYVGIIFVFWRYCEGYRRGLRIKGWGAWIQDVYGASIAGSIVALNPNCFCPQFLSVCNIIFPCFFRSVGKN